VLKLVSEFAPALKKRLLWVVITLLSAVFPLVASGIEPGKSVIILSSEDPNLPAIITANQAIRSTLKADSPTRIQFFNEAQDNLRIPNDEYDAELVMLLRRKYEGQRIDLIFALGAPALKFILKHRSELLPETPIIFVTHDEREVAGIPLTPGVTGVWGKIELSPTLETALLLHPDTQNVVVVTGSSYLDKFWLTQAQKEFQRNEHRLKFTYLTDISLEDLRKQLAGLPLETIVLFLSFTRDIEGNSYSLPEALSSVAPASIVPMYGVTQPQLGNGIVGGSLLSYEALGAAAARLGARALAGENIGDIAPQTIPSVEIFDGRELRRWGINEQYLPAGSIVKFREPTIWELYKWRVAGVLFLCIIEALLIVWLVATLTQRRKAERERARFASLVEAEHRHLEEVVANVPGVVWESRTLTGVTPPKVEFVSRYVEKMLGYTVKELLSTPDLSEAIIHQDDRESVARECAEILETGKGKIIKCRWVSKDGRILWVEANLATMQDEAGRIVGLRGVTMDITEHKLAEESLRESEAQLAGIVGSAMDAIISIDENQHVVLFNAAAEKMFGYSAHDATGQPLDRFIPERFRKAHRDHGCAFGMTKVTKRSMGLLEAVYGRRADGGEFPIEAAISQVVVNGRNFFTVILRDITERHQAEENLRQSEERFRNMADTAPIMIWMSGIDKQCTYFNQHWLTFTGRALEQELGSGWAEGIFPADLARCLETYNSAFDRRETFGIEYRLRRADGIFRWLYDCGTPRFSSDGEFLGYIGSCIDVTDRKQTEEALRDVSGRLIRAQEQERSRVARELHDDLNQRLALLSIELEQLGQRISARGDGLRARVKHLQMQAEEISSEVHRLSYQLHPAKLDHLGLVAAIKSFCDEVSSHQRLNIEFRHLDIPATLPKDCTLSLFRIVQESVNNIVKHSGATQVRVLLERSAESVRLLVEDNGRGFDAASVSVKTGLGFISMRERLRLIGGEMSITSKPSLGTQINVSVPLQQEMDPSLFQIKAPSST
jgi:PAS domain S-box-containing protein